MGTLIGARFDSEETMSEAADRAEHLRAQRRIHDWGRRFRKLSNEMPPEVWVYVTASGPSVMAKGEDGRIIERGGFVDQDGVVATVRGGHWDGGDW